MRKIFHLIGKIMVKFKLTRIQSGMFHDSVTGNIIDVYLSEYYLRISVNGRDYFYDTVTGKFNGTGSRIC